MCFVQCAIAQCHKTRGRWNQSIAFWTTTCILRILHKLQIFHIAYIAPIYCILNYHRYPPPPPPQRLTHTFLPRETPPLASWSDTSVTLTVWQKFIQYGRGYHDIFLFVPNISSEALPLKILSAECKFGFIYIPWLFYQLQNPTYLTKWSNSSKTNFFQEFCHNFEVLLIGWEASL